MGIFSMTTVEELRENVAQAEKLLSSLRISLAQDGICAKNESIAGLLESKVNTVLHQYFDLAKQYKDLAKSRK
jgi:hypothetical protein